MKIFCLPDCAFLWNVYLPRPIKMAPLQPYLSVILGTVILGPKIRALSFDMGSVDIIVHDVYSSLDVKMLIRINTFRTFKYTCFSSVIQLMQWDNMCYTYIFSCWFILRYRCNIYRDTISIYALIYWFFVHRHFFFLKNEMFFTRSIVIRNRILLAVGIRGKVL